MKGHPCHQLTCASPDEDAGHEQHADCERCVTQQAPAFLLSEKQKKVLAIKGAPARVRQAPMTRTMPAPPTSIRRASVQGAISYCFGTGTGAGAAGCRRSGCCLVSVMAHSIRQPIRANRPQ